MKCPVCDSEYFYVKDPDNPFKYYKFKCDGAEVVFEEEGAETYLTAAESALTAHCIQCVWQGKFEELTK